MNIRRTSPAVSIQCKICTFAKFSNLMKTYFRLLYFAKPIEKFAIPYIIATLLSVFFNTFNFTLLAPLLDTLFVKQTQEKGSAIVTAASSFDFLAKFRNYIDFSIENNGKIETLEIVCLVILVSVLLSNLFRYLSQRFMEDLRVHTLLNLRKTVFNNVMDLHIGYFNSERKGDIVSKVASDVQVVQYTVTNTLQVVFKEPLQLIFYVFVLLSISVKLTLFALLVIPISGFIISRIVKRLKAQATAAHESFAKMIGFLDESLSGIKIIKAFNSTERTKYKFHQENEFYSNINRKMVRRQQLASPVSQSLGVLVVVLIVLYGGRLVIQGGSAEFTPSEFILYIAVFSQVMQPVKAISDSFSSIHSGIAAGERVLELIDTKPEMIDKEDAIELEKFNEALTFEKVSFYYGKKQVLNDVSFTVGKGKTIALVGPSGGGKSTIMDLIPRFNDPASGSLKIDGIDIRNLKTDSLRKQLGTVNQDSFLFNDTIFNNIAYARPDATVEEVVSAARIANAHEFILNTENGYQTSVGDRGNRLSGGQRQRVCIARAVLANPPIMLLDEATSALDTESERLVQEALNNLMKNRTSIVIAHRLSTVEKADRIVVINKGKVMQMGNHKTLMQNSSGLYYSLVQRQLLQQADESEA